MRWDRGRTVRQAAATASARRRAGLEGHGAEDAGDDVRVEDRRDGLEPALAAIRAGAHVEVKNRVEQASLALVRICLGRVEQRLEAKEHA
jgi:hypothetical protein